MMNDREYAAQKKRVATIAKKWLKPLGLLWWHVDITHCREGIKQDNPDKAADNWEPVAKAKALWEYARLVIEINTPAIAEKTDDDLERIFVHECCHALVNEMREWSVAHEDNGVMGHEERVVCHLANAFLWTYQQGRNDGKADRRTRREARP